MIKLALTSLMFFFFNDTATTEIYTLSLHDALPISIRYDQRSYWVKLESMTCSLATSAGRVEMGFTVPKHRSEEHTSELQSQSNLVCRLLLEKKNAYNHRPKH